MISASPACRPPTGVAGGRSAPARFQQDRTQDHSRIMSKVSERLPQVLTSDVMYVLEKDRRHASSLRSEVERQSASSARCDCLIPRG